MKRQRIRLHPVMPDLQNDLLHGRMNRREFLRLATLLGASLTQALQLAACSQTSPTTLSATPVATEALTINRGGTMKIGTDVQTDVDHPARLEWIHAANQFRQVAEYLTETDEHNITHPWLLERWEADEDVRTWTLFLRPGVTFNNGDPLTADDVIFTMNQWLDPDVKSSMRGLMSYLSPTGIERVDDATIRLHLDSPQIGLPEHLFHYPAMILHRHFDGNFVEQPIGTGPFLLDAYLPGERVVLKRRSDYWKQGSDGQALPYLDEIIYLHYNPEERVEAMQAGLIDSLLQPNPDDWQALQHVPGIQVYSIDTSKTLVLRMRVDREPWNDVRVRNALKLCQDRERILDVSFLGQGEVGFDAHIAPAQPDFCEQNIPKYNPDEARALLQSAGYTNGLQVTLITKNDQGEPAMAQALKELAEPAGFIIRVNILEPERYWEQWTDIDLGITSWGHRPLATMTLALGYSALEDGTPSSWNETHWVDEEFNELLREAEKTLDTDERRAIMCKISAVMGDRGPIGISYWSKAWTIVRDEFQHIRPMPSNYDLLYDVWKQTI